MEPTGRKNKGSRGDRVARANQARLASLAAARQGAAPLDMLAISGGNIDEQRDVSVFDALARLACYSATPQYHARQTKYNQPCRSAPHCRPMHPSPPRRTMGDRVATPRLLPHRPMRSRRRP